MATKSNPLDSEPSVDYIHPRDGGRLETADGAREAKPLTTKSKCLIGACVAAGVAGVIIVILGVTNIFGPVGSIGFYASVAGGSGVVAAATGGVIWIAVSNCRGQAAVSSKNENQVEYSPVRGSNATSNRVDTNQCDPKIIVKNFLESIKTKASDAEVFIFVSTNNAQPQLLKYSHFDNPFFPNVLYGDNLNKGSTSINVSNIQSIEIIPKIASVMQLKDKEKLAQIGITFDESGFINIPSEKFMCEKSVGSNNYHVKISSREGIEIASINAKMSEHHSYCIVHWARLLF